MNMFMRILFLAILGMSCAHCGTDEQEQLEAFKRRVDPELKQIKSEFNHKAKQYSIKQNDNKIWVLTYATRKTTMADGNKFGEDGELGVCMIYGKLAFIYINQGLKKFKHLRKAVVFHELGHCKLDLDHDDSGSDIKIMNTAFLYNKFYDTIIKQSWPLLEKEFFEGVHSAPKLDY